MKFSKEKVQQFRTDLNNIFPDGKLLIVADRTVGVYALKIIVQKINTNQVIMLSDLTKKEGCELDLKRSGTGICAMVI